MRILLPTLHVRDSDQAIPLAAGNLRACLPEDLQRQTKLLDFFPGQTATQLKSRLLADTPEVIAFPLYLWNRQQVLQLARELRAEKPGLFLLAGGPEASADSVNVIREGQLDGVICGEGEEVFAQLLNAIANGTSLAEVPGYLPAGTPADHVTAAVCRDLERLPSPWLSDQLPLQEGGGVLWEVARGCPFNCAFCYDAKGQQGVRPLPWSRLESELGLFVRSGVGQIWVLDSTFNAPAERGKKLLRLLLERAPQIHYHLEAKADFLDQETIELLTELSCSVQIGLQSANPQVLEPLHRALKPQRLQQKLRQLSAAGVTFGLDLIYGLPGDSHSGFRKSLDFALQLQPNQVDMFPLAILPGTELHQRQLEFGLSAGIEPPYQVQGNRTYPPEQMAASQNLAAAADIFYNRGRAVGFFLQLCIALKTTPASILEDFFSWLSQLSEMTIAKILAVENWLPSIIRGHQLAFVAHQLTAAGKQNLIPIASDLVNYHYACAELLLTAECPPASQTITEKMLLSTRWQRHRAIHLQQFQYALEDLENYGGQQLTKLTKRLIPEPTTAIFMQRQGEFIVEGLQDNFASLLRSADGHKPGAQLLAELELEDGLELLHTAVAEGLLIRGD